MPKRRLRVAILLAITVISISGIAAAEPARFVQDRFAIGFWVDPPVDGRVAERYKEIADANFTMIIGGFGGAPDRIKKVLRLCKKYDLKALVHCPPDVSAKDLPEGPACWGYGLRDEPNARDFQGLRERVDQVRQAKPGKLAYINLFPNYASPEQLGTPTYEEHVAQFMETVCPDVLSMDHYPIMKPGADGREGYCANLETCREYSLKYDVPFWNFFNCMPYGPHADPTEAQLRWQIYTSIAYGAKGVMYFCYYTPAGGEFPKGGAIIGRDDRPTRHYEEAKRINAAVKNLGPTLMKLTSTGVFRVHESDEPAKALVGSPVKDLGRADYDPKHDFLVGMFKHQDGRRAVLLLNYRHDYAAWPTVVFDADETNVVEVCKKTGKEIGVLDDSPDLPGLQLSFDSGDARLFLMK